MTDEGDAASKWLVEVLGELRGKSLRLVRMSDQFRRYVGINSPLNHSNAHTALADAYPFLIVSESSLLKINNLLKNAGDETVLMNRFRPNIVIKGVPEFSEYNTNDFQNTNRDYILGLRKPCQRCKITTIDQANAEIRNPKQPLKLLSSINPFSEPGAYFGQYAVLISGEGLSIKIGDELIYCA